MRISLTRVSAFLPLLLAVPEAKGEKVSYAYQVRPVLSDRCFFCHGPDAANQKADLRLDLAEAATAARKDGSFPIKPGNPDESEIIRRLESTDPDEVMPPPDSHREVSKAEIALLRRWISEGAHYEPHWAFRSPVKVPVPTPSPALRERVRNPVDAFLFTAAEARSLPVAPDAPPEAQLRRVHFALAGLPPSAEEMDKFLADPSPEALDREIDRLLAAPEFAEQLALDWLDAARFADTYGYQADRNNHLWPWRDYVLRSFRSNKPYNIFLTEQLAGDLMPGAGSEQVLATAFNRLHRMTNEGGSVPEEFRTEGVADRVNTLGAAVMGLTLECARCHDHKYDPLSTKEYYQLGAMFENIDEFGLYAHFNDNEPSPTLTLFRDGEEARQRELDAAVKAAEAALAKAKTEAAARFAAVTTAPAGLPAPQSSFSFDARAEGGKFPTTVNEKQFLSPQDSPADGPGRAGNAVVFDGENGLGSEGGVAAFGKADPFTFSLWIKPAEHKAKTVLFHRCQAEQDSASEGYELLLDDGHPVFSMIHFWPGDAVRVRAPERVALNEWTHLAVTHDGSARAAGLAVYINGARVKCETVRDGLTRNIGGAAFAMGIRFRDIGFRGGSVDDLMIYGSELTPSEIASLAGKPYAPTPEDALAAWARDNDDAVRAAQDALTAARRAQADHLSAQPAIMIMREMSPRRPSHVRTRGAYDTPGEEVHPDVPAHTGAPPLASDAPRDRLALARWLTAPDQPLTARVYVNRLWQLFYGRGLTPTTNDFGSQGALPSHPELLDWLAREFMESGWDIRAVSRLMVSSRAYRLSSVPLPEQKTADPQNVFLTRFPRHRLPAELVRDNALAVSGLLVRKTGGPSVRPYQPAGLWEESGTGATYTPDTGEGLYRRSVYSFIKRTAPPANMLTFDSNAREVCTVKRETTNTPLQGLVLLNDPQFTEAARVMAERATAAAPAGPERVTLLTRKALGRLPTPKELEILLQLREEHLAHYTARPVEAAAALKTGASPPAANIPAPELAADAAVALALFNHDEFITVR